MGPSTRALLLASLVGSATAQEELRIPFQRRQAPYTGPGRNSSTTPAVIGPLSPSTYDGPSYSTLLSTSASTTPVYEQPQISSSSNSTTSTSTSLIDSTFGGPTNAESFSYQPLSGQGTLSSNGASLITISGSKSRPINSTSVSASVSRRTRPPDWYPLPGLGPSVHARPSGSGTPYRPIVTAPSRGFPGRNHTRPPPTEACSGSVVNILDASLDWWYSETYTQVESTIILQTNSQDKVTAWSVASASTTLDITSAIADPTCTSSTAYNDDADQTMLQYSCWSTPTPVAAATTTVEQTAYRSTNITTGSGAIPNVVTTPTTSAALTIGNSSLSITSGAPVVQFSAYEVVQRTPGRHWNGSVGCIHHTRVHNLSRPYSFDYTGYEDVNGTQAAEDGVVGRVQFAFLRAMGLQDAVPGTFVADPTVVVVVEKVVAAAVPLTKGIESPEPALETPGATLPSGLSYVQTTPTETGTVWVPLSPRVEQSESALDVPTKTMPTTNNAQVTAPGGVGSNVAVVISPYRGDVGGSKITLAVPVHAGASQSVVTAVYNGQTITATALPQNQGGSGDGSGGVGMLISAVASAAQPKPSNALEVLTEALQDLTASAVATIIGAFPVGASNGNVAGGQPSGGGLSDNGNLGAGGGASLGGSYADTLGSSPGGSLPGGSSNDGSSGGSGTSGSAASNDQWGSAGQNGQVANGDWNRGAGSDGLWPTAVITLGSHTLTATIIREQSGSTAVVVDGQTAFAGGNVITVDGTRVSVAAGGSDVVIGGSTTHLSIATPNPGAVANIPLITLGSSILTANAATQFNIGGSILSPGREIVVSGTTISLRPGATEVVVNGHTEQLSAPIVTPAPLLTLDGTVYKPNLGSTYNIGSQALVPGGAAITVSGETISLLPGGSSVVVDGIRYPVSTAGPAGAHPTITAPPILTIGGQVYTPNGAGSAYVISGQTLTPGGSITLSGINGIETISLSPAANTVLTIANAMTITSAVAGLIGAAPSGAPILTINGQTYTAISYNAAGSGATYIIDGATLTPGGRITLIGSNGQLTTISLVPAGTAVVEISSHRTSTSTISGAYGVLPTNAPILTIGGETLTAFNNEPAYLIPNNITLEPGELETVTINGQSYIVSLSPHATLLEIEELGPGGAVTSTIWETLFPATRTVYSTAREAGATEGASPSVTGAVPIRTGTARSGASRQRTKDLTSVYIVAGCLLLACW